MNRELLRRWIIENKDSHCYIENVPARVANRLPDKYGYLNLETTHNDSPSMREMVDITLKYNGVLEGYIISFASERDDCRIMFDGFTVKVSADIAMKIFNEYYPSTFTLNEDGYRFWWD